MTAETFDELNNEEVVERLSEGKIGVIPTDTIYGIVAKAENESSVEEIYKLKNRDRDKPLIVLAESVGQIENFFGLSLPEKIEEIWPAKVSIVFPCSSHSYIHRGEKSIAFRIPDKDNLLDLIKQVGPIVAPSANLQDQPPAKTIREAKRYFGSKVDFYVGEGRLSSDPSTVLEFKEGNFEVIREGAVNPAELL